MYLVSSRPPSQVGAPLEQARLVVASPVMTELLAMAESAAKSPGPVLVTGESGVGKDLVARHIHSQSRRRLERFVTVNCAGLPEARFESELFGQPNDDLSAVGPDRQGKLRLAHAGTLFLDEVGDMNQRMQAWLLRFLEDGELRVAGSDQTPAQVDVRVVAATHRDLDDLVAAGHFRDDLLYRLRVIHLHVPALRERAEDVHALIQHFLAIAERDLDFTDDALRALQRYDWPGNVRELRNVVEQLIWLSTGAVVDVHHLPHSIPSSATSPLPSARRRAQ